MVEWNSNRVSGFGFVLHGGLLMTHGGRAAAFVLCLSMVLPVFASREQAELRYGGRSLSQWREIVKSTPARELGEPEVIQSLMEIVGDPHAPGIDRKQFAMTLGRIGPAAAPAVPMLIGLLESQDVQSEGDDAVNTRLWVLKSLTLMGPTAREAREHVRQIVIDEGQPFLIRSSAMEALTRIAPDDGATLSVLVALLEETPDSELLNQQEVSELRRSAAEALGLLGPTSQAALPAMIRALESDWPVLRRSAASAIGEIGPRAELAIEPLLSLILFDTDDDPREAAADALAKIGSPALPALTAMLEDEETFVRLMAVRALSRMPTPARGVKVLRFALQDEEAIVRVRAAEGILLQGADPEAIQILINGLRDSRRDAVNVAFRTLKLHPSQLESHWSELEVIQQDESLSHQSRASAARLLRNQDQ